MKGHTKIELTNVKTGEKELREENNMVTNALQLYLSTAGIGGIGTNILNDSTIRSSPLWQTLVGGLMLFDSWLEENVDNVLPCAGVQMIGNGAYGVANNDEVTELGSYNDSESGWQEDGSLKLVWDFSTTQANGTIQCACLSSADGGYVGAGNATSQKYGNQKKQIRTGNVKREYGEIFGQVADQDNHFLLYGDYEENTVTYIMPRSIWYVANKQPEKHWYTTGKIEFATLRYGMSAVDLFEEQTINRLLKTETVTIPEEIKTHVGSQNNVNNVAIFSVGKNVYILFHNSNKINISEEFYILKINDQLETAVYKMKNNTGVQLEMRQGDFAVTEDEYALLTMIGSPADIYKIKITDNTEIIKIENIIPGASTYGRMRLASNDLIYDENLNYLIDAKKAKMIPFNKSSNYTSSLLRAVTVIGNPLLIIEARTESRSTAGIYMYRRNDYLATINNLEEPVIKTPEKTMKVTYTLTFD